MPVSLFEDLIQNVPAVFYRCDCDEHWTTHFINKAIADLCGYPAAEFIDNRVRTFASIIHPEDVEFVDVTVNQAVKKHQPWTLEYRIITKDEQVKWVAETGIAIYSVIGEVDHLDGFIIDRSKRKQLEHELAKAQKMEAVGQLAAGIAHEINTPIQFVGDNLHFLSDAFSEIGELAEFSGKLIAQFKAGEDPALLLQSLQDKIEQSELPYLMEDIPTSIAESRDGVQRVSEIVRAMKEFSHPGKDNKEFVDLKKMLESTITVSRNEWKYVADVETDFADDLPLVNCFPGEINQVFLNVVVNAAHAIESKQQATGERARGSIKIKVFAEPDFIVTEIVDTGCGIEQEHLDKVFDPFFTTKEVGKGTGQGLSMAYSTIIDKHDGSLVVESELGEGTKMTIRLPLN